MSPETPLRADAITVMRDGERILHGLELDLHTAEMVAIEGVSGAGKSTLLAALCGLIKLDAGSIWVRGQRTDHLSERKRSNVRLNNFGLVFQGDELLPELTLAENVSLPLRLNSSSAASGAVAQATDRIMDSLKIGRLKSRMPFEVSGGQLQRAAIARAVIHDPAVVLADEPTASLDAAAARKAMSLLIEAARSTGASVVVVTHDDVVAASCDRRLILENGRLTPARADDRRG